MLDKITHVECELVNTEKLSKKLVRIGTFLIVANSLPTCLQTVYVTFTEFKLSLPTLVCRMKVTFYTAIFIMMHCTSS